jgi:FAD:protein FMN transferase
MNRKEFISLIILLLVVSYGFYRYQHRNYTERQSRLLMDTVFEISASSQDKNIKSVVDSTFDLIAKFETNLSEYKQGSYLWKINHSNEETFTMDPDVYAMLVVVDSLYKVSHGMLDVSIGPVTRLWDYDTGRLPNPDSLKKALKLVDFSKIKFDKKTLYKPKGYQLNLGCIAKGYAVDKAVEYLQKHGAKSGVVDCRSSIRIFGQEKEPFIVGIQHPRKMDDVIGELKLHDQSIGTSGDYQQYFELNGKRYHHILNPHTGYPYENTISVTVIAPNATIADGLSTALFVMPPAEAINYAKDLPNTEAVIYYLSKDGIVSLKTTGMKDILKEKL